MIKSVFSHLVEPEQGQPKLNVFNFVRIDIGELFIMLLSSGQVNKLHLVGDLFMI